MGGDGYEPGGYGEPDIYDGYEPDDIDLARMRFGGLFPYDERHFDPDGVGHFTDPEMDRFVRSFDPEHGEESELFRAALFLRGWRLGQRILWPAEAVDPLRVLLLLLAAARCAGPHLTPGGGDLTRVPSAPLAHARATLTAAPPARVPCPAGATG
jgi:hypothetical protein